MAVTEIGDPRLQRLFGGESASEQSVKPVVRLPRRGLPPLAIGGIALAAALILFVILESGRESRTASGQTASAPALSTIGWDAPPPLYVPPTLVAPAPNLLTAPQLSERPIVAPAPVLQGRPVSPPPVFVPAPAVAVAPPIPVPQPRVSGGAPLVIDTGNSGSPPSAGNSPQGLAPGSIGPPPRMRASSFANRSTTVPQGHLIPAVLETGFDSTQAGFARALVSRDVRSFDGGNVLIPRGSRLIGEYRAEVAQGQRRAIILWTRLIRPDGMTIAMASPAVDTVGRGGVPASVNSHFFQRFGDALLQSTVDLGSTFAGRAVTGPVVVMQGNATSAVSQLSSGRTYTPTLTVAPGKSISVFVAHDLDFSTASRRE